MSNIRVFLQDLEEDRSETGIPTGELEGECWEDCLEIATVLEVS